LNFQRLFRKEVPPGRFRFTVPENGFKIDDCLSLDELLSRVQQHYIDNGIPLPEDWSKSVEDQLCRQLPEGWCVFDDGTFPKERPSALSLENIIHAAESLGRIILERVTGGDPFVSQEIAEKRAEICTRCYENRATSYCASCAGMTAVVNQVAKIRGDRRTKVDRSLLTCGVCGCRNEAIVHIKSEFLLSGVRQDITESRPEWCWLKNPDLNLAEYELKI
jgi:hypothetical protein